LNHDQKDNPISSLSQLIQIRLDDSLPEVQIVPEADPTLPCPIELPEKDRPVLMAATSNKVDYLMTGDSTHFGKYFGQTVSGVKICRLRDYLVEPLRKKKSF